MSWFRRAAALALCAAMIILSVCSCGKSDGEVESTTAAEEEVTETEPITEAEATTVSDGTVSEELLERLGAPALEKEHFDYLSVNRFNFMNVVDFLKENCREIDFMSSFMNQYMYVYSVTLRFTRSDDSGTILASGSFIYTESNDDEVLYKFDNVVVNNGVINGFFNDNDCISEINYNEQSGTNTPQYISFIFADKLTIAKSEFMNKKAEGSVECNWRARYVYDDEERAKLVRSCIDNKYAKVTSNGFILIRTVE